jgi:hypothetical protein
MTTESTPTVQDTLAKLEAELNELGIVQTRAQQDVHARATRMRVLTRRMTAIRVAKKALAGLPPLTPLQEWFDHQGAWRETLCDESLDLPTHISDPHTLGVHRNLTLSIRTLDFGPDVIDGTGYDLTTLRLGVLMREAGFEPVVRTRPVVSAA